MSSAAVQVEGLGKRYRITARRDAYRTLRDSISNAAMRSLRALGSGLRKGGAPTAATAYDTVWALRDISCQVDHGEALGVIGRNGAGKSTLLKILSRVTKPTTGRAIVDGRVGALLEVGTGFHPELTGRENIFLNGAILGMSRRDIARRFDEIVDFSGVERYLDTAVKYYSSGMYMRLAFAVAAHLEPDILVIDEVLAVGDAEFQKKCLGKMGDARRHGRTVLFVSHNMTAVQNLCKRALWLKEGQIAEYGETRDVVAKYLQTAATRVCERIWEDPTTAPGNDVARIHRVCARSADASLPERISVTTPIDVEVNYWNFKPGSHLNVSLDIRTNEGVVAFASHSTLDPTWRDRPFPAGLYSTVCRIPGGLLNDQVYHISVQLVENMAFILARIDDAIAIDVVDDDAADRRGGWYGGWVGAVRPPLTWSTALASSNLEGHKMG